MAATPTPLPTSIPTAVTSAVPTPSPIKASGLDAIFNLEKGTTHFLNRFNDYLTTYSLRLLGSLLILCVGIWLTRRLVQWITNLFSNHGHLDQTFAAFMLNMGRIVLYGLVIIVALNNMGVPTTSILAVLGTAGLAVALALKDSLNNVSAGLTLLLVRPFKIGETVEVGGKTGTVADLNLFHTVMDTPDNRRVMMPNAKVLGDVIVNFSRNDKRRVDISLNVSYQSDLKVVKEVLMKCIAADPRILTEPAPFIGVTQLADSGFNLAIQPWVKAEDYRNVLSDLSGELKLCLETAGMGTAYPRRDVHIHQTSAEVKDSATTAAATATVLESQASAQVMDQTPKVVDPGTPGDSGAKT